MTSARRERSSTRPRPTRATTSACRASPSRSTTTDALLAAARTKATKRARAQAEQLANGAEVDVGEVRSIAETTSSYPVAYEGDAAAKAASTPVMPGSQTLSVQATVVFAIR